MDYKIITNPNPILRKKSEKITLEELKTKDFKLFIKELIRFMYTYDGVGIASPQIGVSKQIFVIAKNFTPDSKKDLILINPSWEKLSKKFSWDEEGCLSVPNIFGQVRRYDHIMLKALDLNGKEIKIEAKDFFARIIQHETDHLNGILFIDKAKNIRTLD